MFSAGVYPGAMARGIGKKKFMGIIACSRHIRTLLHRAAAAEAATTSICGFIVTYASWDSAAVHDDELFSAASPASSN